MWRISIKNMINRSVNFIKAALNACDQTYYSRPNAELVLPGSTWTQVKNVDTDQVCTMFKGKYLDNEVARDVHFVAFRGTDGLGKDWLTNLSIIKKEVPLPIGADLSGVDKGWFNNPPRIHSGFWDAWQSLKPDVVKYFEEEDKKGTLQNSTIWIVGHSMGSATSMCCAWELYHYQKKYGCEFRVLTCGSPRFLDFFAKNIIECLYPNGIRVCNAYDIVTFACNINGYHCFKPLNLWSSTYWQCFINFEWVPKVSSHLMGNYLQRIDVIGSKVLEKFRF